MLGAVFRAVLFDLDGVLVDSREAWFEAMSRVAKELQAPAIARERFDATFGQGVDADIEAFYPGVTAE